MRLAQRRYELAERNFECVCEGVQGWQPDQPSAVQRVAQSNAFYYLRVGQYPDTLRALMSRSRTASVALAAVLLAGCGSGSNEEPTAPAAPPSQASETASPSPTATPVQPPTDLPSQITGDPVWTAAGEFVAAFPDLVVTLTAGEPATLTGTGTDGTQRWSGALQRPEPFDDETQPTVLRLRDQLGVVWTGKDENSDYATDLTLLDPATGEVAGHPKLPGDARFSGQLSLSSLLVQIGGDPKVVTLRDGGGVTVSDSDAVDGLAPIARLPHEDRIGSVPAQGPVQTTGVFVVDKNLAVRQFRTISGQQKVYYQVVDTTKSKAVAPATLCLDFQTKKTQTVDTQLLSPSAKVAGVGQAVVQLDTGRVVCLTSLDEELQTAPTALADDGSAFGATRNGTFYVDPSGTGKLDDGGEPPVALLKDVAIFAGANGSGVVAYKR